MASTERPVPEGGTHAEQQDPQEAPEGRPGRAARFLTASREFVARVYRKAEQDNIFFLAGSIAFNVLVAIIPLILVVLGIAGLVFRARDPNPTSELVAFLLENVPPVSDDFHDYVKRTLNGLLRQTNQLLSIGTLVFLWIATRLVGTLRTVLREIFDIHRQRGFVQGKLFDVRMVLAAGTLFALNVALTLGLRVVLEVIARFGIDVLGLEGRIRTGELAYAWVVGLLSIWAMFLLIYRYLPPQRIGWSTAVTAATFTAILFELMKEGFSWYVATIANYASTYGNLATLAILIFWIYYSAVIFILGGEVAQVAAMRRTRRRQRERLS